MRERRPSTDFARATITRRRWLGGLAAAAVWVPGLARAERYGPKDGTRVLIIGDSMIAGGLGLYLARALGREDGYNATRYGKSSTGLARPDFYDWDQRARELVLGRPFDATVVMFGGNDAQGIRKRSGGWIRWQDEGWREAYARRIVRLSDILAPQLQQIFWVGMPVMRPTQLHERVRRINTIARAEMAIRKNAKFVDIWSLLADQSGGYTDRIAVTPEDGDGKPRPVVMRAGDGIHMTVAGARYVAEHVRQLVHTTLSSGELSAG